MRMDELKGADDRMFHPLEFLRCGKDCRVFGRAQKNVLRRAHSIPNAFASL